jgi:two-component system response regulator CssR
MFVHHIYLVEDEPHLHRVLATYLEQEGWRVTVFSTGSEAQAHVQDKPSLWILDIMLPGIDGFELIRQIKALDGAVPVIFISARDQDLDRVLGLEMGSDDYLAKPFLPRELVIRTRKLLERCYGVEKPSDGDSVSIGPYTILLRERTVLDGTDRIDVTSKEFDLLCHLVKHVGHAFSRDDLLNHVWGTEYFGSDRVVDDLVRRVRKKLPHVPIETMYGFGYRLVQS